MNRTKLLINILAAGALFTIISLKLFTIGQSPFFEIVSDLSIVFILLGMGEDITIALAILFMYIFSKTTDILTLTMQKMKSNVTLKQLALLIMLLGAGLVSPSNGVDDKVDKLPLQMLIETIIIILAVLSVYFLIQHSGFKKYFLKKRLKTF